MPFATCVQNLSFDCNPFELDYILMQILMLGKTFVVALLLDIDIANSAFMFQLSCPAYENRTKVGLRAVFHVFSNETCLLPTLNMWA